MALSRAEVEGAGILIFQRQEMGLRKIQNMDVVADAGAVRRVVIRSEDADFRAFAFSGLHDERDEVGFRVVVFAVDGRRPRRVEIAEGRVLEAMDVMIPAEDLFKHQLGLAVGVDGNGRLRLLDGDVLRHAVCRRRAGEHDLADAVFRAGLRQIHGVGDVVAEVFARQFHGFADFDEGREMDDALRLEITNGVVDRGKVLQIPLDEFRPWVDRLPMTVQQRVEDADFMAAFEKVFRCATADVAGAAGNKNFHDVSLLKYDIAIWFGLQ